MIIKMEELQHYIDADADMIPLHAWNKQTKRKDKIQQRGKTPINGDWTTRPKDINGAISKAKKGHNVGYRLSDTDLIVDVDPRNYIKGMDSLIQLQLDLGITFDYIYPTVLTGGGGFHFYMTKPSDLNIRGELEAYPGVEFKSMGRQVVAAGSKHPNGEYYLWDEFSDLRYDDRSPAPTKLLELIERPLIVQDNNAGTINNGQLETLLDQIDIEDFGDDGLWFPLMCASHHGTAGTGIEEFVAWSIADTNYADDEHLIRVRWDSLGDKTVNVRVNTLYKVVLEHGGTTSIVNAQSDFNDFEDDEDEDFSDIIETKPLKSTMTKGIAVNLANQLSKVSSEDDIVKAIRSMLQAGVIEKVRAEKIICDNTGINKTALKSIVSSVKEDIIDDLGRILATKTLDLMYYKTKGLFHNGDFWAYTGKYWRPVTNESVGKRVLQTLDKMRTKLDMAVKDNTIKTEALGLIANMCSTDEDRLELRKEPKPVINCINGELWVDSKGGLKLQPHRPTSNLTQVLEVEYSPGSECKLFDKAIRKTFSNFPDAEDLVRHFEEYMGYTLYPIKHKPLCWLFKGPGGDGKSTLMQILGGLLGDAVLPTSIDVFKSGMGGDKHASAGLVGKLLVYDDDLNANTVLPDGAIKSISDRGELTANPKGRDMFKFRKSCTLTLLSNGFPKTKTVDRGFRRRATVIPFNKAFHEQDGIFDISDTIIKTELSGVLNRALEGFARLRERGDFDEPTSCVLAKAEWLTEANNIVSFVDNCLDMTEDSKDRISCTEMYSKYTTFCTEFGVHRVETKTAMVTTLKDLELWYGSIGSNKRGFRMVKFNERSAVEDFDEEEDL